MTSVHVVSTPPPDGNPPPYQPAGGFPNPPQGYPPQGFPQQGFPQQGFPSAPPPGYQPYGQPPAPQRANGMSIASLVLSLVNIIPCFWIFPLPALLGVIFGFVGRSQLGRAENGRGKGLATAGIIVGLVFIALGAIFWIYVSTSSNCYRDGSSFHCGNTTR
ncbi:MAG: hypothetical protein JWN62_4035 [Acidimicrobiales bacterium]|nr:hypothetical protein [Acidimicrobiales bacterium]